MALGDRDYMRSFSLSGMTFKDLANAARRNLASTITALALLSAAAYAFIADNPNAELRAHFVQQYGEAQADEMLAQLSPEDRQAMLQFARLAQQFQGQP